MEEFEEVTLASDRLILKRARYDLHYEEINKAVCDTQEHLEPWIPWAKTKPTPEETRQGLRRVTGKPSDYTFRLYLKSTNQTKGVEMTANQMIGMCGITHLKEEYEVGYWCHVNFTRKGYISEAVDTVLNYAVNTLHANKFVLKTQPSNEASKAIAKKFEFVESGTETFYSELRPEWGEYQLISFKKEVEI